MPSRRLAAALVGSLLLLAAPGAVARGAAPAPITLAVNARDIARRLLHVRETLPAGPGTLALAYPEWLPGEHAPTGPVTDVMGLHVSANGQPLAWRRDPIDLYTIRVEVPKGASAVDVTFDFALTATLDGYSSAASATDQLLLLSWNQVLLYPAGKPSDALTYRAGLLLPAGWRWGTPLHGVARGDSLAFEPVTLTRLVDSPVLAGAHFKRVDLAPGAAVPYTLDMACDSEEGLAIPDSLVTAYRALVREGRALFGGGHHREYHFLLTLSDHVPEFGLEHAECSDDRVHERTWLEDDARRTQAELLAHEFAHSWCGKHRRPAGLATPDYGKPMRDELLWVYEGLAQYLGFVLSARSGARDVPSSLDHFARTTALQEMTRGREWRPLVDTAVEASRLYEARDEWALARRSVDFYDEGALLWLEADVTIRRLTHGQKSLDDFCRRFMGGDGPPTIVPYERADVVAALDAVAPYAWDRFLSERLDRIQPHAPLGGITGGGWTLAYGDTASDEWKAEESHGETVDERCAVGLVLEEKTGLVKDVTPGSAADRAGLAPDMTLVAVNGRRWNKDVLHDALRASRDGGPLDLLVTSGDFFRTLHVDDHAGLRYPHLERLPGTPDLLGAILAPLTAKDAR